MALTILQVRRAVGVACLGLALLLGLRGRDLGQSVVIEHAKVTAFDQKVQAWRLAMRALPDRTTASMNTYRTSYNDVIELAPNAEAWSKHCSQLSSRINSKLGWEILTESAKRLQGRAADEQLLIDFIAAKGFP